MEKAEVIQKLIFFTSEITLLIFFTCENNTFFGGGVLPAHVSYRVNHIVPPCFPTLNLLLQLPVPKTLWTTLVQTHMHAQT